jgi:hypothetical protein
MKPQLRSDCDCHNALDRETLDLISNLTHDTSSQSSSINGELRDEISQLFWQACKKQVTQPIVLLFKRLFRLHEKGISIMNFGIYKNDLCNLALKHQQIDKDKVSLGSRLSPLISVSQEIDI